jgi:hypothetical protein
MTGKPDTLMGAWLHSTLVRELAAVAGGISGVSVRKLQRLALIQGRANSDSRHCPTSITPTTIAASCRVRYTYVWALPSTNI